MPRTRGKTAKQSATKAKTKVARGRPVEKKLPPRIDATPEQMAQAMFALPADYKWQYDQGGARKVYKCVDCGEAVYYPETLYRDGRCKACKKAMAG
jgi:formylmethanofuran dehydrogenase subunit E